MCARRSTTPSTRENLIEAVLYGLGEEPATLVGPT
jgi:hypothetical protein